LLTTIKVKLVKYFPSLVIRFDTTDSEHGKGAKTGVIHRNRSNLLFPLLSNTRIFINTQTSQKEHNLILWKEITRSLGEFENYKADHSIISTIVGENSTPGLSHEDRMVLKAIFSPNSDKIIKEIKEEWTVRPNIRILLTILLSIILFFIFYEVNNYFNFTRNAGNSIFRQIVSVLIISQLVLASFYVLKFYNDPESSISFSIWQLEIYVCSFSIIVGLLFHSSDILLELFKAKWLRLVLNPFLTIISLYLAYQIIYLFVRGEVLRFMTISIDAITIGLSIVAMRFYLQYEKVKITSLMQEKEYEISRQKEMKIRAELNALQSRINPHFLYNALNSIASLAHIDSKRTESMALSLSKLFRYTLNREVDMISTIGQEIEMTELYLEIEKHRFVERLNYSILVDDKIKERTVPRLLIQPLVENSIKHGISKITGQGFIKVKIFEQGKDLIIEIYDNGPCFPEGLLSGYGLQNTYDKLSLVYKKPYEIKFLNSPEKYVQITLKKI
jgi:sensor histidine kinase YesM